MPKRLPYSIDLKVDSWDVPGAEGNIAPGFQRDEIRHHVLNILVQLHINRFPSESIVGRAVKFQWSDLQVFFFIRERIEGSVHLFDRTPDLYQVRLDLVERKDHYIQGWVRFEDPNGVEYETRRYDARFYGK